ncbi:MAG: flagellar hook-basal body complex protein [Thermodesulfobacteriota bacterium]
MGVSSSLYASISGLSTMGNAMSVLGDNVSNVNTVAFKSSRATFQDVLSQSVATAAGSAQVGRGVTLTTIDGLFAQGSFESTSSATDLAIGGQGFFMLRASDSAEADMYTRAGEFRFDREGYLVSPSGHYVQGWTIDPLSGEVQGTIGDINLGKSTPPVETTNVQVIANVDSRKVNETNETRLYDAWDGRNAAQVVPTDPINANSYEYTTSIKVYDSKGASHDLTVYFDRTSQDNQWEFLVTCDPTEDQRVLSDGLDASNALDGSNDEADIYTPDTTYNYENHKGAGALLYGVIDFSTSGSIDNIWSWRVPPDAMVDPAQNTNRIVLSNTDQYYSFEANFTGAATNQQIELNLGARYTGLPEDVPQILVCDAGAVTSAGGSNAITKETFLISVFDSAGSNLGNGDTFYMSGYDNDGTAVSMSYTIADATTEKVQDLLDAIDNAFGCTASIDAQGRIVMTDDTAGNSGLSVTRFTVTSVNNATPFGGAALSGGTHAVVSGGATANFLTSDNTTAVSDPSTALVGLRDNLGGVGTLAAGQTFQFTGTAINGNAVNSTFTIAAAPAFGSTVQHLLDFLSDIYADGALTGPPAVASANVSATLGADGRIRIVDNTGGTSLDVTLNATTAAELPFGAAGSNFVDQPVYDTLVNVTTSKQQVVSAGRALNNAGGTEPVITADTPFVSVFDSAGVGVETGDTMRFVGVRGDGISVDATFTVGTDFGPPLLAPTDTVQDLLTWLEDQFGAEASIDGAGRLTLTDRRADEVATGGYTSLLEVTSIAYTSLNATVPTPFGTGQFATIPADTSGEDGSRSGDTVSIGFSTEALSTTQYANSSTTIFQDQDGYAAGFLQSVSVDTAGIITGNYSNGQVLEKAQVALANFNNLAGLRKEGGNIFRETTASGAPVTGAPGTNGLGSIAPNSLEQSNVDLGTEFVKLITTQRGFQANSKIITTTDEMLADLINIKR